MAHSDFDIAFWLPSLPAEGGPAPEEILPAAGPLAAGISGFFAERGGKPPIPRRRAYGRCSGSSFARPEAERDTVSDCR